MKVYEMGKMTVMDGIDLMERIDLKDRLIQEGYDVFIERGTLVVMADKATAVEAVERARTPADKVRCDCGHIVERSMMLQGPTGTVCSDCFDRV